MPPIDRYTQVTVFTARQLDYTALHHDCYKIKFQKNPFLNDFSNF